MSRSALVLGLMLAIQDARAQKAVSVPPGIVTQAPLDARSDIAFHAQLSPREVHVGEQANYQVGVFIAEDVKARLRRNPEFVPPELRAMLGYELASRGTYPRTAGSRRYEVHVFQRAIFPLLAGRHVIAPARLNYSLQLSTSIFSREESHTLRSESLTVIVRDVPSVARPADFSGAVGRIELVRRIDLARLRVGEPFVLTLTARGEGNIALLPRPALSLPWAQIVDGPERVELDTTGTRVRGVKDFDYIITPIHHGQHLLSTITYSYFDPIARRFQVATIDGITLGVSPGALIAGGASAAERAASLSIRRRYSGPAGPPVTSRAGYWLALAAAPIPAAVALVRRPRRRAPAASLARLRALALARSTDAAALRRTFSGALAQRLGLAAVTLADRARLVRALRRRGVTRETAAAAASVLLALDAAVFDAHGQPLEPDIAARAAALFAAVDREATRGVSALGKAVATGGALSMLLLPAAWALAGASDHAEQREFARGVALYDAAAYPSAQRVFHALAIRQPRAADAWANAGASAWQARDTAMAAVAWQRALRLKPRDGETRERLRAIPAFRDGWRGDVPPVSLTAVAWLGAVAWLALWTAGPLGGPRAVAGRWLAGSLAALTLLIGLHLSEVSHGRRVAVIKNAERLRGAPALGAEPAQEVMPGEVVRVASARGPWSHVRLPDGRAGWLPAEGIVSLERHE
ncbi:MAG: SH3 domain-containing protein [Gemmatimonadaceae bacterium]